MKLQMRLHDEQLAEVLLKAMVESGATQKTGTAPRHPKEREVMEKLKNLREAKE